MAAALCSVCHAQIYRWDNGELLPGTESISPGPGVTLDSYFGEWNTAARNLRFADFSGGLNLSGASFSQSWLDNANFSGANLCNAYFGDSTLTDADLSGANLSRANVSRSTLTSADLSEANLTNANLSGSTLTNADLIGATATRTDFSNATTVGFTQEQLYSTASYETRNLQGIGLGSNDLSGWDFRGQNLSRANLSYSTLTNANLSEANLTNANLSSSTLTNAELRGARVVGANFGDTTSRGFTQEQLASTASYQTLDLQGILLESNDLSGWSFRGQNLSRANLSFSTLTNANLSEANLTNANLSNSTLTNADLSEATVTGASFYDTTSRDFTKEQLYSTASYRARNLRGIGLGVNDLSGWNFRGQNLSHASLSSSTLANADLSGARLTRANFGDTTSRGFTQEQLYSTASYLSHDLRGIGLVGNDLSGWDFRGQNLEDANLDGANLADTDFSGAIIVGARLSSGMTHGGPLGGGFTVQQLYSTASYQNKNLSKITFHGAFQREDLSGQNLSHADFAYADLSNTDLSNANLTNASFRGASLYGASTSGANFFGADLRFSEGLAIPTSALTRNAILPSGDIDGVDVREGESLRVASVMIDLGLPSVITIKQSLLVESGALLSLVPYRTKGGHFFVPILVDEDARLQLGGALQLAFPDWEPGYSELYIGRTYDLFDWPAPLESTNRFSAVVGPPGWIWDTSELYTTGEVTLLAIVPEPSGAVLAILGAAAVLFRSGASGGRRRRLWASGGVLSTLIAAPAYSQAFTLTEATVADINQAIDQGVLSSERLVELYLARIAAYDDAGPNINSLVTVNERALAIARELDAERRVSGPRSQLHGIPVVLKDNIDTFDMRTTAGSLSLRDSFPPDDAFLVQRLRDAGAIIFAKANLDEFGLGLIGRSSYGGQTLNPYDLTKVPMGSSGGTGAAVAANLATLGIGVDAIGSVRLPASAASLVGLKPTLGLISRDGIMAYDRPRETAGPMTRTVTDLAVMMDVLAAPDAADPWTADSQGKIPETYTAALRADALDGKRFGRVSFPASGAINAAVEAAYQELAGLNAGLESTVSLNFMPGWYGSLYDGFEHDMNRYLESLGPERRFADLDSLIASGEYLPLLNSFFVTLRKGDVDPATDPAYAAILDLRNSMRDRVLAAMDQAGVDALIYPTLPRTPAPVTVTTRTLWFGNSYFDLMSNAAFLGFPAITVPAGFTADGLPLGIEFMGRPYADADLIGYAYAYEQATHHRRPPPTAPPLPGESVPEPDATICVALMAIVALALHRPAVKKRGGCHDAAT